VGSRAVVAGPVCIQQRLHGNIEGPTGYVAIIERVRYHVYQVGRRVQEHAFSIEDGQRTVRLPMVKQTDQPLHFGQCGGDGGLGFGFVGYDQGQVDDRAHQQPRLAHGHRLQSLQVTQHLAAGK